MCTIGKAAARAQVSADSIRYYEREGLIAPVKKSVACSLEACPILAAFEAGVSRRAAPRAGRRG